MARTPLLGPNPILMRELRSGLRNVRAFAILAIYIALLGAIVTANFPGDLSFDVKSDGGQRGRDLFWVLILGQMALVALIIPALATGALAQERERQTLTPLLLTPLSPLQIVWGKAGGVLSLVGLMLLATIPLTALCIPLLGGVDFGMIVAGYAAILGFAVFTTGFGLYCSARWPNATRALMCCYAFLPIVVGFVVLLLPVGASASGLFVLYALFVGIVTGWQSRENSKTGRFLGVIYKKIGYLLGFAVVLAILWLMVQNRSLGLMLVGVGFVFSYFVMAAQWGMLQTARELMVRADPEAPMRQKIQDWKDEWRESVAPTPSFSPQPANVSASLAAPSFSGYVPGVLASQTAREATDQSASGEWAKVETTLEAPRSQTLKTAARKTPKTNDKNPTYGKEAFLSDTLNPIFAREMRVGVLGKWHHLARFGYIVLVASQILLVLYLYPIFWNLEAQTPRLDGALRVVGGLHLAVLMVFAAWFGARAIAPEREGQTLEQLFTLPLPASQIISGKMGAVLVFSLYVWVLAIPLALLMGFLNLVALSSALRFLAVEFVFGFLAAAWGIFCSFHMETVRKALATALSGVAVMVLGSHVVTYFWELLKTLQMVKGTRGQLILESFFPHVLAFPEFRDAPSFYALYLLLYLVLGAGFLVWTAWNFSRLARESN